MRRLLFLLLVAAACATTNETICEDVGNCTYGGSTDWVDQCKASAAGVETEARNSGCGDLFDGYYACAKDRFACTGNVATYPGCDRTALDACLSKARNATSCADLSSRCGDAGASSCTATQSCRTRCFLDVVKNACAPTSEELDGVAVCSASCL